MTRRIALAGFVALTLAGLAAPVHAGGKRLPKAISLVERIRGTASATHYVRTSEAKPAPAQSGALRLAAGYSPSHYIREAPPVR